MLKSFTLLLAAVFITLCSVHGQVKKPVAPRTPEMRAVDSIRRIFQDFLQYDDHYETHANMDLMKKSLLSLPQTVDKAELPLLINVWMYYDPADLNVREIIKPILFRNREQSLIAVQERIKQKKDFEFKTAAPFSELVDLEAELKSKAGK